MNDPEKDNDDEIDAVTPEEMEQAEDAPPEVMEALDKQLDEWEADYYESLKKAMM